MAFLEYKILKLQRTLRYKVFTCTISLWRLQFHQYFEQQAKFHSSFESDACAAFSLQTASSES